MSDVNLGNLIVGEASRDAIHAAVAPMIAGERLKPGTHVGFLRGSTTTAISQTDPCLGIVDPFLQKPVLAGQRFWLVLYPKTVTSLRHEWEHPAFPPSAGGAASAASPSRRWLTDFAARCSLDYDTLMHGAANYLAHGNYLNFGGLLEGQYVPDEFWPHYEVMTGGEVPEEKRGSFFSCSC